MHTHNHGIIQRETLPEVNEMLCILRRLTPDGQKSIYGVITNVSERLNRSGDGINRVHFSDTAAGPRTITDII